MKSLILLSICLLNSFYFIHSVLENAEALNSRNKVEFRIVDENRLKLPNQHRTGQPSLKLSFHGANVNRVTLLNTTQDSWWLELSDHSNATVSVEKDEGGVTEYYLQWYGGRQNLKREVCFHYGYNDAKWYQTYQSYRPEWPLNTNRILPKKVFNSNFYFQPKDNTTNEAELILEHIFLNTDGFSVMPDQDSPLFLRRDPNNEDPILCFSVNNTVPYKVDEQDPSYLDLKIHIFATKNIRSVVDYVVHESGYIPKPKELPDLDRFKNPMWLPEVSRERNIEKFADDLLVTYQHGELVLTNWQSQGVGFEIDTNYLPDIDSMIGNLTREGYRLTFLVQPELNNSLPHTKGYFLKDRLGHLTRALDFSLPSARAWYTSLLRKLFYEHGIDSYLLSIPQYFPQGSYVPHNPLVQKYPALLTKKYLETVLDVSNKTLAPLAYKSQDKPIFSLLVNWKDDRHPETWLQSVIANSLSVSAGGYSFVVPYFELPKQASEATFVRWLQSVTLMPGLFFTMVPWLKPEFSANSQEIAKKFVELHAQMAPTFINLAKERIAHGAPIMRPMWYHSPDDARTYSISDQYMLGEDLLVAPIIDPTKLERKVYLPAGTWKDQHDQTYVGPKEVKIGVPLEELPYFKRVKA